MGRQSVIMEDSPQSIVIEATTLIDFLSSEKSILPLISRHLGKLHVTRPVLEEVADLHESQCEPLGITIVDLTLAQYQGANSLVGGLSFDDCTCFVLARDNEWVCMANDKRLRSECCRPGGDADYPQPLPDSNTLLLPAQYETAHRRISRTAPHITSLGPCGQQQPAQETSSPIHKNGAYRPGQHDSPQAA
jgi:rRNA-processing protein FCF1